MNTSLENIINKLGKSFNNNISTPILVGGWAVNQLGLPRNTLDFDFMIFEEEFDKVSEAMVEVNYKLTVKTSLYARFESDKNKELPYLDCLFANRSTYGKLVSAGTGVDIFGAKFILPDVLHIIAMKLHAVKHGEQHRLGKDFNDIVSLIKIHNIDTSAESDFAELCHRYADNEIYSKITNAN